jgi:hypothetical protein
MIKFLYLALFGINTCILDHFISKDKFSFKKLGFIIVSSFIMSAIYLLLF